MGGLFGTDGVRGIANRELTAEVAFRLGRAVAVSLGGPVVVGRDPRGSGDFLEAAQSAGICSVGADVWRVGIIPTPGVAYLVKASGAAAGVMVSASHNPAQYNGIKVIGGDGYKLSVEQETRIERLFRADDGFPRPEGTAVGRIQERRELVGDYAQHLVASAPCRLDGLSVIVDCANGSAFSLAPAVLTALGARVRAIACEPDGANINEGCGSTQPSLLADMVRDGGADCGVAYDGDADRLVAVDERGAVVDGDQLIGMLALDLKRRGRLEPPVVVGTVASNLGLGSSLERSGIELHCSAVGDRFVLELMKKTGALLGGEQSGHIVFLQHGTTGDGILSSIQLLALMKDSGQPLSKLAAQVERFPQFLADVPVSDPAGWSAGKEASSAIEVARQALGTEGRILIRPSGTEPVLRLLVEGRDARLVAGIGRELTNAIEREARPESTGRTGGKGG